MARLTRKPTSVDQTAADFVDDFFDLQAMLTDLVGNFSSTSVSNAPCDDTVDGLVHVDINRDGTVDLLDATSLFVAQTMKGFGASSILTQLYASRDRSHVDIDHIVGEVSSAVAQVRGDAH
jgi:hypothetical protein